MAAQPRTVLLCLAALCLPAFANVPKASLLNEKPRLGGESLALASHRGLAAVKPLIAPGIARCLCDESRRSRSTSKERDGETELDYFGARYLSAGQGRFVSPDSPFIDQTAHDPQSWNLYSYVRNNPLVFVDPTGNDCVYLNNSGNGIENINSQINSAQCGNSGGYWVNGTATQARFAYGSLILTGTTNGTNRTQASYGLGPDLGLLALKQAGDRAANDIYTSAIILGGATAGTFAYAFSPLIGAGMLGSEAGVLYFGPLTREVLRFAQKYNINASSEPGREILFNLEMKVDQFIGTFRLARIRSVFPGEYLKMTVKEAIASGNTTVRKLLTDGRFTK